MFNDYQKNPQMFMQLVYATLQNKTEQKESAQTGRKSWSNEITSWMSFVQKEFFEKRKKEKGKKT